MCFWANLIPWILEREGHMIRTAYLISPSLLATGAL